MRIDAVVLAARPNTAKLAPESHELFEANINIAGRTMLSYVLSAIRGIPEVSRIFLVGQEESLKRYEDEKTLLVPSGSDLLDNIKRGLQRAETEFILVSSSDIPLITKEILADFLCQCLSSRLDFMYPISRKEDCERKYPGVRRTYVKLKDGTFTGGHLFFVRKSVVARAWPMIEKMIKYRKSPLKMASILGFGFLFKVALGVYGLRKIEEYVGKLFGISCKAVISPPEIGIDVDKPADLELCQRVLGK